MAAREREARGFSRFMHPPLYLLLPFGASLIYVFGMLMMKRATTHGIGLWRITFIANWVMGLLTLTLWGLGGRGAPPGDWWQPLLCGLTFVTGQICTYLAIDRGDVSVATPVLGAKVLLVAFFSVLLLAGPVPLRWWIAAALSSAAIVLFSRGGSGGGSHRRPGATVLCAAAAAGLYAATDVLVQKWTPAWGAGRFLPLMFGMVAVYSFAFVPFFRAPLRALPREAWRWVLAGAALLTVQNAMMAGTLGVFGNATVVNIIYSLRGLWSVVVVWLVGHWFASAEQHLGRAVLGRRLAGAALMAAAVVLALA